MRMSTSSTHPAGGPGDQPDQAADQDARCVTTISTPNQAGPQPVKHPAEHVVAHLVGAEQVAAVTGVGEGVARPDEVGL